MNCHSSYDNYVPGYECRVPVEHVCRRRVGGKAEKGVQKTSTCGSCVTSVHMHLHSQWQ